MFYQPLMAVTGPAYTPWLKKCALGLSAVLLLLCLHLLRPLPHWASDQLLWAGVAALLWGLSLIGFLRSTTTINAEGITQTWLIQKQVAWPEVRSAKLIGLPFGGRWSPPRLVVRTGIAFYTFNGGSMALQSEFARIALAFELKP